jgi:NAD dependent epimerase/dehydratase
MFEPAMWQGKKVLVTGAGGFIGSHLTERLAGLGAVTRAFLRYNSAGSRGWLEGSPLLDRIEFVFGDIRDPDGVRRALRDVDTVFHLAALIGIPYSYEAPSSYVETNVVGTLNVLQAARESGTRCVVQTSTSEVYGSARYTPIDEAHPLQGQSPYAATKIGADKLAESFHLSFGLPVVTVRPFNAFGPRQSSRAIVPTIISQCLGGDRLRLGNLDPTRDLNFVANTVDGFLAAATSPAAVGQTINLGSGREIRIGDLLTLIAGLLGQEVRVEVDEQRVRPHRSEVNRLLADNGRARELLDWKPRVSLEEGLQQTIAWLKENRGHYRSLVYAV